MLSASDAMAWIYIVSEKLSKRNVSCNLPNIKKIRQQKMFFNQQKQGSLGSLTIKSSDAED
jgi:hypothetical protein